MQLHLSDIHIARKWGILATLFLATSINYLVRQSLGCTMTPIAQEFGLNSAECSDILSAFILSYALAHLFVGFIIDRLRNIRLFFAMMVAGWSLCAFVIGLAQSYESILISCYVLGVFEAVNFPICLMIVARTFSLNERAFATGLFGSGAFIATLVAPKFVIMLSNELSWRYAFASAGIAGIIWIIIWLMIFRNTQEVSPSDKPGKTPATDTWMSSMRQIISRPAFWSVTAIGIGIVPCLYFITQWLPSYFTVSLDHGYNQILADKLTLIYLFQDLGMWISGGVIFYLIRKGISVLKAQKIAMIAGGIMMIGILLLLTTDDEWRSVMIFSMFTFGLGVCLSNQQTLKQYVRPGQVAAVAALVGFIETFFSSFFIKYIGDISGIADNNRTVIIMLAICSGFALLAAMLTMRRKWFVIE